MRAIRFSTFFATLVALCSLGLAATVTATAGAKKKKAPAITTGATFNTGSSISEIYVTDAEPSQKLLLVNGKNRIVRTGAADSLGSKIFYTLKQGKRFTVRSRTSAGVEGSNRVRVRRAGANPPQSFYDAKTLKRGLNYVTMRDGIELAMTVRLPPGKSLRDGPFPTYVEHSGYGTAAPGDAITALLSGGGDPLAPDTSTAVGSIIGPLLGYATVSVQMRGSGCSGGSFDLFNYPTTYDGYDMIETVAAQDWVKDGMVGMGGISFSGITQLFNAGTQPPHLSAISPLSVTDDIYQGTGYPGGIFNSGFALTWVQDRMSDAEPAPEGGQRWARAMITEEGDQQCLENQKLRLQTRDAIQLQLNNPFRTPNLFGQRAPGKWMNDIDVPTFLVGQFQDEQTGGHFPNSIKNLKGNPDTWVTLQNGVHVDALGPSTITRWAEFMSLFVAKEIPVIPDLVLGLGGELYNQLADAEALPIEQSRFAGYTSYEQALADFRKDPRVRLLMDNGAAIPGKPGSIGAAWDLSYGDWPIRNVKPKTYFLGKNGKLKQRKSKKASKARYTADPSARTAQTLPGTAEADAWVAQPPYEWDPVAAGKGLGFITPALGKDAILAGTSSLDLWLKSSKKNTDIQATITEVRPDGKETYVQSGWLRANHRRLSKKRSTKLNPYPTHLKKHRMALPKGKFVKIRVPIFPVAHAFRAGSKIRIQIQGVGGDRARWRFDTIDNGSARNTIRLGGKKASKIALSIVKGSDANGTPLPPATALRGQPSRDYQPASNGG